MPVLKNGDRMTFATYKARKRFRKDLEQAGIKVPGATKQSSKTLVNQVPLSSSLKHNDQQLFKLLRLANEIEEDEDREEEAGHPNPEPSDEPAAGKGQAKESLRELVQNMERQAKRVSARLEEQQERSKSWGDKEGGQKGAAEFEHLTSQARDHMTLKGGEPYEKGARALGLKWVESGVTKAKSGTEIKNERLADTLRQRVLFSQAEFDALGVSDLQQDSYVVVDEKYFKPAVSIRPSEIIGEVERSEEAMDDAVVEYSTAAGLLSRFRKSTPDQPVASGVWMRPSVPSTNLLAARVSNALELVRNRMFRLDSMLKEQGHSNQLQVGRMSAIMTWKRDKHEAQANMLERVECIQSAEEFFEVRLRAMSPNRGLSRRSNIWSSAFSPRTVSGDSRSKSSALLLDDSQEGGSGGPSVRFDDVRPKTSGGSSNGRYGDSVARPQTAGGSLSTRTSFGSKTVR